VSKISRVYTSINSSKGMFNPKISAAVINVMMQFFLFVNILELKNNIFMKTMFINGEK
jgi:hypothetical protein